MTDYDKVRIRPLDEKSDYSLWRLRVESAVDKKGLTAAFTQKEAPLDVDAVAFESQKKQASGIIVEALGDHALRVVRTVKGKPVEMLEKLDGRYDSKTTASKISKMFELVSLRYTSPRFDITKHIDKMAAIVEQLAAMQASMDESLTVGILVASIDVVEMRPVISAIKTLADGDVKWDGVAERLIEEWRSIKNGAHAGESSAAGRVVCDFCSRPGHTAGKCWINPANPQNRLKALKKGGNGRADKDDSDSEPAPKPRKSNSKSRKRQGEQRAAMARTDKDKTAMPDTMMVDSGTTSHMTAQADRVFNKTDCTTSIRLADDSTTTAHKVGVRKVNWRGETGPIEVTLSETLVARDIKTSLLSVQALVKHDIAVLFLPGKAVFLDLLQNNKIIGYASQGRDGLFYISDNERSTPMDAKNDSENVQSMMAAVESHAAETLKDTPASVHEDLEETSGTEGETQETSTEVSTDREGPSNSESESDQSDVIPSEFDDQSASETEESNSSGSSDSEDEDGGNDDGGMDRQARVWHLRLGHVLNVGRIRRHISDGTLPKVRPSPTGCGVCVKAKFRKSYPGSLTKAKNVGHLHADVKGMVTDQSGSGARYFVVIVDEYSRFVQAVPMVNKSEASTKVLSFVAWFERQTGQPVKSFYKDGGQEFTMARQTLRERGLDTDGSTAYTPASNGLAERHVGLLLQSTRATLLQAHLPMTYW